MWICSNLSFNMDLHDEGKVKNRFWTNLASAAKESTAEPRVNLASGHPSAGPSSSNHVVSSWLWGSGITGGSSRCLQEAPSSPLWHKKQSIEDPPHHHHHRHLSSSLVSPICKRTPLHPSLTHCLQGSPPSFPITDTTTSPHPRRAKNPSILRCISSAQRPNSSEPALFSIIDYHCRPILSHFQLCHFPHKLFRPSSLWIQVHYVCLLSLLQLGDWRWYFMGVGDRRSRNYTVQTLSAWNIYVGQQPWKKKRKIVLRCCFCG